MDRGKKVNSDCLHHSSPPKQWTTTGTWYLSIFLFRPDLPFLNAVVPQQLEVPPVTNNLDIKLQIWRTAKLYTSPQIHIMHAAAKQDIFFKVCHSEFHFWTSHKIQTSKSVTHTQPWSPHTYSHTHPYVHTSVCTYTWTHTNYILSTLLAILNSGQELLSFSALSTPPTHFTN